MCHNFNFSNKNKDNSHEPLWGIYKPDPCCVPSFELFRHSGRVMQGWTGQGFFPRGGAGRGKGKNLRGAAGPGQGKGQNLRVGAGQNLSISAGLDNLLKEGNLDLNKTV